jgi:acetolactate synthase I/II/III large subunit
LEASGRFPDFGLTFGNPDFVKYAESYGARGWRVHATGGYSRRWSRPFSAGGVHVVAIPIDYSENMRVLVDELTNSVPTFEPAGGLTLSLRPRADRRGSN